MTTGIIFCVDGGGTNTRARLYRADGEVLAETTDGPCNISTDPLQSAESVRAAWRKALAAAGLDDLSPGDARAVIGAAGSLPPRTRQIFFDNLPPFGALELVMDGLAALVGASNGRPATLVVAGTGAVGHRLFADGRSIRRDGWGWIGGDRGGGVWMGRKAIRHAIDVYDGLVPATPLAHDLLAEFTAAGGVATALQGIRPYQIGAYARRVFDHAREGDSFAQQLVERSVMHFERLVLALGADENAPLFVVGGLSERIGPMLADRLGRAIDTPVADAVHGCHLIAIGEGPKEHVSLSDYEA